MKFPLFYTKTPAAPQAAGSYMIRNSIGEVASRMTIRI